MEEVVAAVVEEVEGCHTHNVGVRILSFLFSSQVTSYYVGMLLCDRPSRWALTDSS